MNARRFILTFASLTLSLACEKDGGVLPANDPPRTFLNIVREEATLDTTDYRKHLHWWGTDRDGAVVGYIYRWDGGWQPEPGTKAMYAGQAYQFTTATTDTFNVPLGGEAAVRTFTIRAMDDLGAVDPDGVSQAFALRNSTPHIRWNEDLPLPRETLPAAGFGWRASDFDGRETINTFRIWLDGDSAHARVVHDTLAAFGPEDFGDRIDQDRTVFIQGYDDAMAPSPEILTHTWRVRSASGRFLVLRQFDPAGQINRWEQNVYGAILAEVVGGDAEVLDMRRSDDPNDPSYLTGFDFVTKQEVAPLLSLFDGVLWLGGTRNTENDAKMARNLALAEDGIREYVASGGRMLITGCSVLGTDGGFSDSFGREVLGIPKMFYRIPSSPGEPLTTDIPLARNEPLRFPGTAGVDSLVTPFAMTFLDYFLLPESPGTARYWVDPGTLARMVPNRIDPEQEAIDAALGVVADGGAGGRIGVMAFPYARIFPNATTPAPAEGIRLFREVLTP